MTTIVTRAGKTTALTWDEADANFINLNNDKVEESELSSSTGSSMVGYLPAGTSAVPTTVQNKLRETVSVKDFGAVGDGVADDTEAFLALFNLITSYDSRSAANKNTARALSLGITIPPGRYKVTAPLTIGKALKVFWWVTIDMRGASIHSTYSGAESAVTIHGAENCKFIGLNIDAPACTPLKIINSLTCEYTGTTLATNTGFANLEIYSVHFNNTWTHTRLEESAASGGVPAWAVYAKFDVPVAPFTVAFAPINTFTGLYMTEGVNSIYWEGGTNNGTSEKSKGLMITGWEHEGFNQAGTGVNVCTFKNIDGLVIDSIYQEIFPSNANSLFFEDCARISLTNPQSGSYFHFTKFKNCNNINIKNYNGGAIKYEGVVTNLIIDNIKVLTSASRLVFRPDTTATIKRWQVRNLMVRNQTDTADIAEIPDINTGRLSQADNWLVNPRCIDALGNVTTTYCATTDDALYQTTSPLGFIETLVTIDSTANFPIIAPTLTAAKLAGAKTSAAVLVQAWRVANLPSGISGLTLPTDYPGVRQINLTAVGGEYGTMSFVFGDWLLSYSLMKVDTAATNVQLVWDYNLKPPIGTKFLFGGAIVYAGYDIRLPLI